MDVFQFDDYLEYVRYQIRSNEAVRGYRARLAEAAGCRASYLSQVLGGQAMLTPDQAAGLCELWAFDSARTDYFLALVQLARAATPTLARALRRQLSEAQARNLERIQRAGNAVVLPLEHLALYHSTWHRMATHALVSVSGHDTLEALARRLRVSEQEAQLYLSDLAMMGLVKQVGNRWQPTDVATLTPSSSPFSSAVHTNWRLVAIERMTRRAPNDLHYTTVVGLTQADLARMRQLTVEFANRITRDLEHAAHEECVCLSLDLFTV